MNGRSSAALTTTSPLSKRCSLPTSPTDTYWTTSLRQHRQLTCELDGHITPPGRCSASICVRLLSKSSLARCPEQQRLHTFVFNFDISSFGPVNDGVCLLCDYFFHHLQTDVLAWFVDFVYNSSTQLLMVPCVTDRYGPMCELAFLYWPRRTFFCPYKTCKTWPPHSVHRSLLLT